MLCSYKVTVHWTSVGWKIRDCNGSNRGILSFPKLKMFLFTRVRNCELVLVNSLRVIFRQQMKVFFTLIPLFLWRYKRNSYFCWKCRIYLSRWHYFYNWKVTNCADFDKYFLRHIKWSIAPSLHNIHFMNVPSVLPHFRCHFRNQDCHCH